MSNVAARRVSSFKFLITCVDNGRVVFHNGAYMFRMRAFARSRREFTLIRFEPHHVECFDILVKEGIVTPPTATSSALVDNDAAIAFLREFRDVCSE